LGPTLQIRFAVPQENWLACPQENWPAANTRMTEFVKNEP